MTCTKQFEETVREKMAYITNSQDMRGSHRSPNILCACSMRYYFDHDIIIGILMVTASAASTGRWLQLSARALGGLLVNAILHSPSQRSRHYHSSNTMPRMLLGQKEFLYTTQLSGTQYAQRLKTTTGLLTYFILCSYFT